MSGNAARTRLITSKRVGGGQNENTHECRGVSGETHIGVIVLGAEVDIGDIPDSHDRPVLLFDHQLLEFFSGLQIRIGDQAGGHHGTFGLTHSGKVVVVL